MRRLRSFWLRRFVFCIAALILVLVSSPHGAEAAFDSPRLTFYTLETEHFRITYHTGLEEVAQHVANIAESIHAHMGDAMGYSPTKDKTEISLLDTSESANGSASALPFNAVRLLVTAPEDFSPLGDVDDWYLELVTHEYTHVLHTDNIHGIPALVNAILGKTLAPNQVQPRWILEGIGVYQESARTSAGRLRNSMWDMFMRADVLNDNVASLDQMSNIVRRWPQGNLFYLYGSSFIEWIATTYGEEAIRSVSRDYGGQIIPWGINRSIRRATGKTYVELYPAWIASLQRRYREQEAKVRARGIREGGRITNHGQVARYPRWIPDNAWPEHRGGLVYYRDDQHGRVGLYALDIKRDAKTGVVTESDWPNADLVARTTVESVCSFLPDGSLLFNSTDIDRNLFAFGDLERMDPGVKSPFGLPDNKRVRLTEPLTRAADPSVSPDGRRVVFTQNHAGTRSIHIADLQSGTDGIKNPQALVPTSFLEQAFTPRWSPDGTHVAYSVWKRGGYRDIRYVDVRDGTSIEVTNDRAVDGGPSFSNDGRWLYFHSDRTGIMNVFAYEIATGKLKQVTNVVNGAYSPEPSFDNKTLAYVGYGTRGFDLFALPINESQWLDAPDYIDEHPSPPVIPSHRRYEPKKYSPFRTLMPRRYAVQITPGNFGQAVIVSAAGNDIAGLHGVAATAIVEVERPEIQGSIGYNYLGLPIDFSASVYRSITPRGGYAIGSYKPTVIQESTGFGTSLIYARPGVYDNRSYVVSHSVGRVGAELPVPIDKLDPYETPSFPQRGIQSTLHFGFSYTNSERYLRSVGAERGSAFSLSFDWTDPALGSQFAGFASNADFTTYFLMPWLKHHSVAFHTGAGTSGGNFPGRGAFFIGGFVDLPLVDTVRDLLIQGGITLRGYPSVIQAGRSYLLTNTEYRFPIVNIDRGASTLPLFINRITGAVFADYGSAFDVAGDARFKTGVGGELWFDSILGYVASFTFRVGYARGLSEGGIDKLYFVAAVPY